MIKAICIGAGGHAEVLLEILRFLGKVQVVGLLDRDRRGTVADFPILGTDDRLEEIRATGVTHAVVGVGGFGSSVIRKDIVAKLNESRFEILSVIHPSAIISPSAQVGEGLVALAGSIIGCGATVGRHVIFNTASSADHHCILGDFSHLAPGVHLGGRVELGEAVHLGVGSSVRDGVKIGGSVVVGAGAVVVTDLPDRALYAGVPARKIKSL